MIKMKVITLAVGLSLSLSILVAKANPKEDEYEKIAKDYVEGFLSSHPENATELGDHRFDDKLSDYAPDTRNRLVARAKQSREKLKKFNDVSQLSGANQVDVRILRDNIDNEIFELEEVKEADWDPLVTIKVWPTVFTCSSRAISTRRKNASRICASAWRRFQP